MAKAYLFATLSLIAWSLYPVLTAFGILRIDPILFVVIVQASAGLGSLCFALPFIIKPFELTKSIHRYSRKMALEEWGFIILAGLCSALFNIFIVISMTLIEPAAAAIIVQTSPIFTMLFSYYLIRKAWVKLGFVDFSVGALSLCGAAIVILGNPQSFNSSGSDVALSFADNDLAHILPYIGGTIALLAAVMVALSNSMRAQVSNIVKSIISKSHVKGDVAISGSLIGESICRLFSIIPSLVIWLIWGATDPVAWESLLAAIITGFFIFNIASAALTIALLYAQNSSVTLISFLGPVISVLWLSLFGLSEITPLIMLGMIIIIIGNISLYALNRPKS